MTQHHRSHTGEIPSCSAGHTPRHIEDVRAAHAGGGHFIECQCRQTQRHPTFEAAVAEWCASMRARVPRWVRAEKPADGTIVQFVLPLGRK